MASVVLALSVATSQITSMELLSRVDIDAVRAEPALARAGVDAAVLEMGLRSFQRAAERGLVRHPILTLIDYRQPSSERRLWVIDLERCRILFHELVAHGKNSGEDLARDFGNEPGSAKTSLGVFVTGETYSGQHGYSLRLAGLEAGINDRAAERAIVVHGAWYVSSRFVRRHGRLGRSFGCPALDRRVARRVIDTIKGGSVVLAYHDDPTWLSRSTYVH